MRSRPAPWHPADPAEYRQPRQRSVSDLYLGTGPSAWSAQPRLPRRGSLLRNSTTASSTGAGVSLKLTKRLTPGHQHHRMILVRHLQPDKRDNWETRARACGARAVGRHLELGKEHLQAFLREVELGEASRAGFGVDYVPLALGYYRHEVLAGGRAARAMPGPAGSPKCYRA